MKRTNLSSWVLLLADTNKGGRKTEPKQTEEQYINVTYYTSVHVCTLIMNYHPHQLLLDSQRARLLIPHLRRQTAVVGTDNFVMPTDRNRLTASISEFICVLHFTRWSICIDAKPPPLLPYPRPRCQSSQLAEHALRASTGK